MASKKNTLPESRASVYTAVAAYLTALADHSIMSNVAEGPDRCVIAYLGIRSYRGKRTHDNSNSEFNMEPNVCKGMDDVDEMAALLLDLSAAFSSHNWISDGGNKDIVLVDQVTVHIPKNTWLVVVCLKCASVVIEESLYSQ
jgi:hypothetical protein